MVCRTLIEDKKATSKTIVVNKFYEIWDTSGKFERLLHIIFTSDEDANKWCSLYIAKNKHQQLELRIIEHAITQTLSRIIHSETGKRIGETIAV